MASAPAFSQRIAIGYPPAGTTVTAGSQITVEIDRPSFQSSSTEVALVIAMNSCPNSVCFPPDEILGPILYNGPFKPQSEANLPMKPPHQNFTVTVPDFIGIGLSQLNVFHVALVGASNGPFTEFQNITLSLQ